MNAIVPPDLARALEDDPVVRRAFRELPGPAKRRHVRSVERAPTTVTRRRRVARAVDELRAAAYA